VSVEINNVIEKFKANTDAAVEVTTKASTEVNAIASTVKNLAIKSDLDLKKAISMLGIVKESYKNLEKIKKETINPIRELRKKIDKLFNYDLEKYKEVEKKIKEEISIYNVAQQKIFQKKQEKLRLKAKEEERRKTEQLKARAKKWEEKGKLEKAQELKEQSETVHVPVNVIHNPNIPRNISIHKIWKAKPANGAASYNMGFLPIIYHIANVKMLDNIAKATRGTQKIQGVEFYYQEVVSYRKREG